MTMGWILRGSLQHRYIVNVTWEWNEDHTDTSPPTVRCFPLRTACRSYLFWKWCSETLYEICLVNLAFKDFEACWVKNGENNIGPSLLMCFSVLPWQRCYTMVPPTRCWVGSISPSKISSCDLSDRAFRLSAVRCRQIPNYRLWPSGCL